MKLRKRLTPPTDKHSLFDFFLTHDDPSLQYIMTIFILGYEPVKDADTSVNKYVLCWSETTKTLFTATSCVMLLCPRSLTCRVKVFHCFSQNTKEQNCFFVTKKKNKRTKLFIMFERKVF